MPTRRTWWTLARMLSGVAILAALVWRMGTGPFLDAIGLINGWSLAAAAGIAGLTTVCCAWRWSLVARGLGLGMSLPGAIAAYYRSQFLNTTLPGGVVGDVHRGVRHGRDHDDVGRGLRAVAWERFAGQLVQVVVTLVVLLVLPSPVRSSMLAVGAALIAGTFGALLLIRALPMGGASRWARMLRAVATDIRDGLLARRVWPGIVLASALTLAGHAATFLIAARTAGVSASTIRLLPLALLVLVAAAVPTNIGGWGPREGIAAASFGVAGLGAGQGVTTAAMYGVMALVTSLPGAAVLVAASLCRRTRDRRWRTAGSEPRRRRPVSPGRAAVGGRKDEALRTDRHEEARAGSATHGDDPHAGGAGAALHRRIRHPCRVSRCGTAGPATQMIPQRG